jgi:hypothetical protein
MNNANGPLHSERPAPTSLTNAPTPPLDTPAVPLSDLVDEVKALVLAGAAAQADVDAILSAPPTPEQISEQIIAETAEQQSVGGETPTPLPESASAPEPSPFPLPTAGLAVPCQGTALTVMETMFERAADASAALFLRLREDIKTLKAERDAAVADADHWRDKFVQVVEPASRSPEDDLKTLAEVAELRAENDRLITRLAQTSTAAPNDPITLAYLRQGWPHMIIADREQFALRLLDDLCRPPHERGTGWIALVRAVPSGVGLTPAELSAATAKEGK